VSEPEPLPEGVTWAVRDPDGKIVQFGTEPIRMEMTAELGEQLGLAGQALLEQAARAGEG